MTKIYNKFFNKTNRQKLRNNTTKSERVLWNKLRRKQMGFKFRRQHGIGKYIVDFYCPELRLVIEIDGLTHYSEQVYKNDLIRQSYLENLGLKVVRYNTENIFYKINEVSKAIYYLCKQMKEEITPS